MYEHFGIQLEKMPAFKQVIDMRSEILRFNICGRISRMSTEA